VVKGRRVLSRRRRSGPKKKDRGKPQLVSGKGTFHETGKTKNQTGVGGKGWVEPMAEEERGKGGQKRSGAPGRAKTTTARYPRKKTEPYFSKSSGKQPGKKEETWFESNQKHVDIRRQETSKFKIQTARGY